MKMHKIQKYIEDRILNEAVIMLETKKTIRAVAKELGISRTTVWKDISIRLKELDYELYLEVKKVIDYNLSLRSIRGGTSTKIKYLSEKNKR